jgi:hypothetical protein
VRLLWLVDNCYLQQPFRSLNYESEII